MRVVDSRDPQTYAIIGAAMEIHRQLGHGFLEAVYQDTAVIEFGLQNIPFQREVTLPVKYKDNVLPTHYRADFIWDLC
jgi:GxxExxY protein